MGKIAKKKKGRPSKSDLSRRTRNIALGSDIRRSLRRRNLTYTDDFDDDDDEQERRREKKLKLVLRLPQSKSEVCSRVDSVTSLTRTVAEERGGKVAPESRGVVSASSSEYGEGNKPFKKRKIDGDDDVCNDGDRDEEEGDGEDDDDDDVRSIGSGDQRKERRRNADSKAMDSVQGTPSDSPSGLPLPDRKLLELILDKLQKKDTYGVYAEPVDPEELPDYHDVIEHPMDFGTIRKKLASGKYPNLEQFENDVFLVCTNAMLYNAPDTIYFKQARSIQELARKKFQRLRIDIEHTEAELKSEQKTKSNYLEKKPVKKASCRTAQEPVGSDFSSGATLATAGETCILSTTIQAGGCERPNNVDGIVDGNSSLTENKPEKAEEQLPGKGFPSKFGKKPFVLYDNRRSTYNISNQPVVKTDSIFTTFDGENKQLVAVGLHSEHSYARSLARFAATLGPVAWRVASRRIEQALPVGFKFGRGWVGEYEPLPTPVLMLGNGTHKHPDTNSQNTSESRKDNQTAGKLKATKNDMRLGLRTSSSGVEASSMSQDPAKESPHGGAIPEGRSGLFGVAGAKPIANPMHQQQNSLSMNFTKSDNVPKHVELNYSSMTSRNPIDVASRKQLVHGSGKPGSFVGVGTKPIVSAMYQQQNPLSMNFSKSDNVVKQVELNSSSSTCWNPIDVSSQKQLEYSSEMMTSKLLETDSRNRNLVQYVPFKQSEPNEAVAAGFSNGKAMFGSSDKHRVSTSSDFVSNQQGRAATYFPRENHEHSLSDPVLMMRMLAENSQNQKKSSNPPIVDNPKVIPSVPSSKRDDSSVATSGAREWMSLGTAQFRSTESAGSPKLQIAAASLYNSTRELSQSVSQFREVPPVSGGLQLQPENRFPPQAFLPQPVRVGNESQLQNNRQMIFPQLVTTDISRFQVQSPWRGLVPHIQPIKKQDMLPPDLNISFQASGSPVRHSSGVLVDSQQPDLALQL